MAKYNTRRYHIAENIFSRCNNKNNPQYKDYGGRGIKCLLGITIGEIYESLLLIDGYADDLQIDRIDNDGNYELSNVRWVSQKDNLLNSSRCHDYNYYEEEPISRYEFKRMCERRGWNYSDFLEVKTDKRAKTGHVKYLYIKMGESI